MTDKGAYTIITNLLAKHDCQEFAVLFDHDSRVRESILIDGRLQGMRAPMHVEYRTGGKRITLEIQGERVDLFLYESTRDGSNKPKPR